MSTDTTALRAVERLIKSANTEGDIQSAKRMRDRMIRRMKAIPMSEVVAKIPGTTVPAKARALGITRQTIHYWLDGRMRPRPAMAKRLERITGISAAEICARDRV